jgi:hypothetical protein
MMGCDKLTVFFNSKKWHSRFKIINLAILSKNFLHEFLP